MFLLKSIEVINHDKEILKATFTEKDKEDREKPFSTLILGENGTGKSFLLKTIADIFIYLDKAQMGGKPKYKYEKFSIEYFLNCEEYEIDRVSGKGIVCKKNGVISSIEEMKLPTNVLAVSFMVNDKFLFIDPSQNKEGMYRYLGVRKSTNATYTSSVISNVRKSVVQILNDGLVTELEKVLSVLHFDTKIEIEFGNITKNKKKNIVTKECIDCSSEREKAPFDEILIKGNKLSNLIAHGKVSPVDISFYKRGEKINFEDCSSGEKHMIFAFSDILNGISDNSLILIDEPEISLHPEWQIQYISLLKKVFGKYRGCHFILASHSHYLVSDLEKETSSIITLSSNGKNNTPRAELLTYSTYAWSAENIIYNVFGLRTTRNYYFESDLRMLLSLIQGDEHENAQVAKISELITKLKKYIYNEDDPLFVIIKQAEEFMRCIQSN